MAGSISLLAGLLLGSISSQRI